MIERRDFREGVQALIKSLDNITMVLNNINDNYFSSKVENIFRV